MGGLSQGESLSSEQLLARDASTPSYRWWEGGGGGGGRLQMLSEIMGLCRRERKHFLK